MDVPHELEYFLSRLRKLGESTTDERRQKVKDLVAKLEADEASGFEKFNEGELTGELEFKDSAAAKRFFDDLKQDKEVTDIITASHAGDRVITIDF